MHAAIVLLAGWLAGVFGLKKKGGKNNGGMKKILGWILLDVAALVAAWLFAAGKVYPHIIGPVVLATIGIVYVGTSGTSGTKDTALHSGMTADEKTATYKRIALILIVVSIVVLLIAAMPALMKALIAAHQGL